jgi:general secretion pathway protein N
MRVEGIAPRTWLLGTVAGWALLVWLLALLGMGNRVQHLPEDPSLVPRLPQLAPAPPERLGPLSQYSEISARPLFSEDRRPQPFSLTAEGDNDTAPKFDYVLTSVLITPTLKMAIVQPSAGGDSIRVKLGQAADALPSYRLTALNPRSAIFEGPDGEHALDLRVFDGNGGQPPTAVQVPVETSDADADTTGAQPSPKPVARPAMPKPPAESTPTPSPAVPSPATTPPPNDQGGPDTEAQIEGIRKRIEERRKQLRQQSQNPPAPAQNP